YCHIRHAEYVLSVGATYSSPHSGRHIFPEVFSDQWRQSLECRFFLPAISVSTKLLLQRIQMTGHQTPLHLLQRRRLLPTDRHRLRTAASKATALWHIHRRGYLALDGGGLPLPLTPWIRLRVG